MILIAVYDSNKNVFFVGAPANIGEILLGRFAGFDVNNLVFRWVKNADCNVMTCHSGHRVTDVFSFCNPFIDIHQRVFGYHGFVHAVKCQQVTFWRPESTTIDTKFIAVHRFPVYYPFVGIVCNSHGFSIH